MATTEYYRSSDLKIKESITIPNLSTEKLDKVKEFVEFTRHFQEVYYLFKIFKTNLNNILMYYVLYKDDSIIRKSQIIKEESDYIQINALVINYISSAKTFVESIEKFITSRYSKNEKDLFCQDITSKIYDTIFSYRLLIRLRDFAQHGHLVVYFDFNNKCCFSLEDILATPQFTFNSKIRQEFKSIKEEINEKYKRNAEISFVKTIAEFELCIYKIYLKFLEYTKEKLKMLKQEFDIIVQEESDMIYKSDDSLNGYIIYGIENNSFQFINPNEDAIQFASNIYKEITIGYRKENKIFKETFGKYFRFKGLK